MTKCNNQGPRTRLGIHYCIRRKRHLGWHKSSFVKWNKKKDTKELK